MQPFDQQRQKELDILEGVFRAFGTQNLEAKKCLKKANKSLEYFESEVISNNWWHIYPWNLHVSIKKMLSKQHKPWTNKMQNNDQI